jgi:hypothetical protein
MPKSRMTIASLLGLIAIVAMILTALRSGSNDWFKLNYTLVFLTLVYAAIAARYRGPFWYGFAIAGWAYFLIAFGPWIGTQQVGHPQHAVNRNIVTSLFLEIVSAIMDRIDAISHAEGTPPVDSVSMMMANLRSANRDGICHCSLTLLFACLGGFVSRTLAKREREARSSD